MSKPFRLLPFLALAFFLILPASARAGTAVLLRDIADEPGDSASSSPRYLTPYKDQIAFLADVPNGQESLWMSDGTGPGTRTLYQTCDTCSGVPEILGTVNGFLLFSAESGEDGSRQLWRSDGTRAGTIPLTPDGVGPSGYLSEGAPIVFTDKVLYFLSCGETQCGVWRSNGTPAGTTLWKRYDEPGHLSGLKLAGDRLYSAAFDSGSGPRLWTVDTKTGTDSFVASWDDSSSLGYRSLFTAAGGKLFFVAPVADGSSELWVSDGTAKGTRALTQLEPYYPFQDTEWMKEMGGRLYFVANDVVHGYELWRSDGTPQGTVRVSDFGYFQALSGLTSDGLALAGGKILFKAWDGLTDARLWISDGRSESTAPFRSLCGAGPCELPQTGWPLVPIGGKVFFPGENGLWSTDGTLAGTHRFSAPPCNWECGYLNVFQAVRGRIAFNAIDATHGIELWTSDGTEAGTRRLTEIPGKISRPAQGPVVAAGPWIYFVGSDSHGVEPWVTNGRETRLLADLGRSAPASGIREQTPVGDRLFFTACDGQESSLWLSGGTSETTGTVPGTAESCQAGGPTGLAGASGRLFFFQRDAASVLQIWSTDGGAPIQISHLSAGDSIDTSLAVEFQGRLLLPIRTGEQLALWQSNAAGDGLVKLAELPGLSSTEPLQVLGGEVYFQGYGQDFELWRTDGTLAGTRKIAAGIYLESDFVRLGSSVLFMAEARDEHGSFVPGLWKTDGTPAGTVLVKATEEGLDNTPQELTVFQGSLYFMVARGSWELWRSDGTPAGTVRAWRSGEVEGQNSSIWFGLTAFAGRLFFALDDGVHGRELWTSDGTSGGTRLLIDLNPGWASGVRDASTLTVAGGRLYFAGNDGVHGIELWESDGTAAGTRLVHDIAPEAASSLPEALTRAGDHLYFVADDILRGRELWALPLAGPSGCQSSSSRLCLNGGRYQVEASWLTREGQSGTGTAVSLSADTGYFWFFDADNVELVAKVLDGQGVNGHVWVFYGALSDVEYTITVTDTQTGFTRRYFNPQGTLASVGDTQGFGPLGAHSAAPEPPVSRAASSPLPLVAERTNAAAAWPCQASAQRLCLGNGRFALEVSWTAQNRTGKGTAVPLTGDTGTFWFFNAANVELVVKVLDGRPINGRHWVFYGALSNVEYTVTVTDTETGSVRTYKNPGGRFGSVADTAAF